MALSRASGESMLVLIVVGLAAGVITSVSPCVLPVLPVVLASGVNRAEPADRAGRPDRPDHSNPADRSGPGTPGRGPSYRVVGAGVRSKTKPSKTKPTAPVAPVNRWRPYGVVAGLVVSFSASVLFGSLVLSALHLPQDLLRDAGVVVLVVIGLSLLIPRLADLLARPFERLPQRRVDPDSNGLVLGLGLGLLYVPCAGPVLATIAVVGATHHIGLGALFLTVAFGVGAGIPLLVIALAGDAIARRTGILRQRARTVRLTGGVVMIVAAVVIGLNLTDGLQRHVPGYPPALPPSIESNGTASKQLQRLTTTSKSSPGPGEDAACSEGGATLENCGQAPAITGITGWLNTASDKPLDAAALSGKVVLIDFWTYSCINCQRSLPHVEAWYSSYAKDGFVVVGVHTPEFAFEHVTSNIRAQAASLGVKYPIAIDNNYATWQAFGNQYWPAEYLIDPSGVVRHVAFGEGDYATTESLIRQLLTISHPGVALPAASDVPDATPTEQQTAETYLGSMYAPLHTTGDQPANDKAKRYAFPTTLKPDTFALSGTWTDHSEDAVAGSSAKMEISYQADDVYLVLGGTGTVTVSVNGTQTKTIQVTGVPKLYTLVGDAKGARALLTLGFSPGVQAYDFTFG
jgi:cytochrome c biogenesis protein CcdA/thiol-disulfide isomerase/thioredoxin